LKEEADHYEYVGNTRSVTIPATLRDSLMARLDRYAPVKEIAQIGAAIGREFNYELIAAVAPMPQAQLKEALSQLTDSGLSFRRGTPPEAIYSFKHALVQDAAYDSLLKSKRQALHGKIARAIEERFPNIKDAEPEVLAHHLSVAGKTEAAVPLWQKAGELSLTRMAVAEAVSHLNKGLELIDALPKSGKRKAAELSFHISLGIAWTWLRGWAASEVWTSFHRGLALAETLQRSDAMLPILWGLTRFVRTGGRVAESFQWCDEMLAKGSVTGDPNLILAGNTARSISCFYHGDLNETLKLAGQVQALYNEENDRELVNELSNDPKTVVSILASHATWLLGYPDQALRLFEKAVQHARGINRPYDLGWALCVGADLFDYLGEPERLRRCAAESEQLGRDNSIPLLVDYLAPAQIGVMFTRQNKHVDGIAKLKAAFAVWDGIGGKIRSPYLKSQLALAMATLGELDDSLQLIDEQIAQVERPGWEERVHYAEILRLKGWMLTLKNDLEGAEKNYLDSLDWAREQKARSWELRTSTSLARLWEQQGKRKEAHDLLAAVYNWFTEGFDTKDLKEAKALLDELSA
jgi:tetratricopeptide (TPR) repeat protein